jgi:hypothetical protein
MAKIYIVGESALKYKTKHNAELIPVTVSNLTVKDVLSMLYFMSASINKLYIREGSVYSYDCKHLCNFKISHEGISISNANKSVLKD